jgi:metal-dependent amidase/aminoacylase/carboxypeptidase family protein
MHPELIAPAYDEMADNLPLLARYTDNARLVDREPVDGTGERAVAGSTDMGNVSQVVPSIHPMIQVAPAGVSIHTAEFATHARSPLGDQAVIDGAKMLALTALDLWTDAETRTVVAAAHAARAR